MIRQSFERDLEEDLERLLARVGESGLLIKHLVSLIDGRLRAEVRANEHPPPHFHVTYDGEDASYCIMTGRRLPGVIGMERYDKMVERWWLKNRSKVIDRWNSTRPSNCPVGPVR